MSILLKLSEESEGVVEVRHVFATFSTILKEFKQLSFDEKDSPENIYNPIGSSPN